MMVKKPLRRLLRVVLKYLSKAALVKHQPEVIAVLGTGQTGIAREAIYTVLREKFAVRRNLEPPEAEFSVPLTILGVSRYPRYALEWLKVLIKAVLQLLFLKPYKHLLILELNTVDRQILGYWLEIVQPDIAVVCGSLPAAPLKPKAKLIKISEAKKDYLTPHFEAADKVGRFYKMKGEEIERAWKRFELPRPRIRLLPGKQGLVVLDSTYLYFPPPLKTVLEVLETLPGKKLFFLHPSLPESQNIKGIECRPPNRGGDLKGFDVVVLRGPQEDFYCLLSQLVPSFLSDVQNIA